MSAIPFKLGSIFGYLLIAVGIILLGWGGWLFYQTRLEALRPPPARILESAVVEPGSVSVKAIPTPTRPVPTVTPLPARVAAAVLPLAAPPTVKPSPTFTSTPLPVETPEAVNSQAVPPVETGVVSAEPLSLAENPLVVETAAPPVEIASEETGIPSRVVAESISLDTPVVKVGWNQVVQNGMPVNVWVVADYAAGWHKDSALPGQGGTIVLSGHPNIKGEVFRYLVDLEPGAVISLYVGDQRYDYAVFDKFIVKDKGEPDEVRLANARWIGPFNEERLTLVTCWPYTNNTHRVIIIAKPVES